MTYPYPTLNRQGNGGAERLRDFLGVTWSVRTRHGQHRVSSPPVGGSVEGGRMLSSHSLSSRTLEDSGGGTLCFKRFWLVRSTNELRPRHRQIPGVNDLGQPSAGNLAGSTGWKPLWLAHFKKRPKQGQSSLDQDPAAARPENPSVHTLGPRGQQSRHISRHTCPAAP